MAIYKTFMLARGLKGGDYATRCDLTLPLVISLKDRFSNGLYWLITLIYCGLISPLVTYGHCNVTFPTRVSFRVRVRRLMWCH